MEEKTSVWFLLPSLTPKKIGVKYLLLPAALFCPFIRVYHTDELMVILQVTVLS